LLRKTAEKHPNHAALVYFDREISYKELDLASDKFATALADLGVKKGDKVAIFLPNTPQFIMAYYGAIKIGVVDTAISPLYKEREVEHQLNDSEAETADSVCTPITFVFGDKAFTAIDIPDIRPPPPTGTSAASIFFKSSMISRPTVP